jgi:TolB-like protein/DNA-binding winged helix-turn-helix (wHTH) protein/tetratricopeptide (TPR) repeat protein
MPISIRKDSPSPSSRPQRIAFDDFELDLRSGELRKHGSRIRLQAQPFRLLVLLLANAGQVVTREEICRELWPTNTFVDFEHGLAAAVNKIRDALGDSADTPKYVETLPKRGYRFMGKVKSEPPVVISPREKQESEQLAAVVTHEAPISPTRMPTRGLALLAAAALVAAALLIWKIVRERRVVVGSTPQIQSLAVLPLINLSGDAGQDFFADGMTEELTTDLGKISALRVISRTSAMRYKDTNKPLREIARELNVDAVVEGTVARSGNHLRVTANLVQASPEKHLWSESYESEVGDALTLQGTIAQTVAREIQVKLTRQEQNLLAAATPVNPEAHDLYLKGLYTIRGMESAESSEKAIEYFQQAIDKDPSYAAAYTALSNVYSTWIPGMNHSPRDLMPKAKGFALKALILDNTLADAHSLLGMIALCYDWDWSAAEKEYEQTMALNPNHVWAHEWHARGLVAQGRTDEAIAEAERVLALSPTPLEWDSPIWVFVLARRYDLARERAQKLLEVAPNWVWGHFEMALIYEQQGKLEKAAQESLRADELFGMDPKRVAQLKETLAKSGPKGYWKRTLDNYRESAKSDYVPPVLVAKSCVRVGDKECAFEWLERGLEERDDLMINLNVEPVFDSLRSDPRFQELVRRVGIPQ